MSGGKHGFRAAGMASSADGRWLVWSEPGELVVFDLQNRVQAARVEQELEPPFELAVSTTAPERLLLLHAKGASTLVRVYSLPQLGAVGEARIKGKARLAAQWGSIALLLGDTDPLTMVDLAEFRSVILPVRGSIQVVAQVSSDQVLVGARGKLEAWSLDERRPTHRLGLPLPGDAGFGGIIANGRLIWFASISAPGTVSLCRLTDGKQLPASLAGGAIKAIVGDPGSSTVIAAVQPEAEKPVQLVALDLEAQTRRVLAFDGAIAAFCLIGAPADAVAIQSDHDQPVLLSLALDASPTALTAIARPAAADQPAAASAGEPAATADSTAASEAAAVTNETATDAPEPAAEAAPEPAPPAANDLGDRLSQWRAQLQAAVVAAPPMAVAQGERTLRVISDEPRSRSRAQLYAWGQAARARTTTTPPPPPQGWRLTDLAVRFHIDMRGRSLLALLYASWLDGEGRSGLPVGVIARCLGNDEDAWVEALAQGRLGRMGWLRTGHGRTRLRGAVGRFLDEAPPRVTVVAASDAAAASLTPPSGPALWMLVDRAALAHQARDLASLLAAPVATIDVTALPAARFERVFADRLLEARLHGALPIVVPSGASPLALRLLDGPLLVAIDPSAAGEPPALPAWPGVDVQPPEATPAAAAASPAAREALADGQRPA